MIKRILLSLLALLLLLVAAVAVNTIRQGSRQLHVPAVPPLAIDEKALADKLAGALRFKTISSSADADLNAPMSVLLRVATAPGHSSMPPPRGSSATGMMSAALRRLDDNQLPAAMRGIAHEMFDTLAPEMSGFGRVAWSNLWLFGPVVQAKLEQGASTSAMLRTTTALTVVHAGNQFNVLPGVAEATVNYRILPGDTGAQVMQHVKETVGNEGFELKAAPDAYDPPPVSPTTSASYQLINRTIRAVFPGTVVAPSLMIGGTDSRHFSGISNKIYRFSPVRAKAQDLARFHGTNERIATGNLAELVHFYHQLLRNASTAPSP